MKLTKFLLSALSASTFAFTLSGCSTTAGNNAAANSANKPNTAIVTSNKTTTDATPAASPAASAPANKASTATTPAGKTNGEKIDGQLQAGKTESLILYVGKETGDYAAYCFPNESDAGRKILASCKDGDQCEVTGEVAEGKCAVPGLEADLSATGRFVSVSSVKRLAAAKK